MELEEWLEWEKASARFSHFDQMRTTLKALYSLFADHRGRLAVLVGDRQLNVLVLLVQHLLEILVDARAVA